MSEEDNNKAVVQRFREILNSGDFNRLDEVCSSEIATGIREHFAAHPFTENQLFATDTVAEGEKVMVRGYGEGTHSGEWKGIPATGKRLANRGWSFFRLKNGKIVEIDSLWDELSHLERLGATIASSTGG